MASPATTPTRRSRGSHATGSWGPPCPQDPEHGMLLAWTSPNWGWYCPHAAHSGWPFYRTADVTPAAGGAQH